MGNVDSQLEKRKLLLLHFDENNLHAIAYPHTGARVTDEAAQQRADELYAAVRELLATHPETAGRDRIDMPYVTATYRVRT